MGGAPRLSLGAPSSRRPSPGRVSLAREGPLPGAGLRLRNPELAPGTHAPPGRRLPRVLEAAGFGPRPGAVHPAGGHQESGRTGGRPPGLLKRQLGRAPRGPGRTATRSGKGDEDWDPSTSHKPGSAPAIRFPQSLDCRHCEAREPLPPPVGGTERRPSNRPLTVVAPRGLRHSGGVASARTPSSARSSHRFSNPGEAASGLPRPSTIPFRVRAAGAPDVPLLKKHLCSTPPPPRSPR